MRVWALFFRLSRIILLSQRGKNLVGRGLKIVENIFLNLKDKYLLYILRDFLSLFLIHSSRFAYNARFRDHPSKERREKFHTLLSKSKMMKTMAQCCCCCSCAFFFSVSCLQYIYFVAAAATAADVLQKISWHIFIQIFITMTLSNQIAMEMCSEGEWIKKILKLPNISTRHAGICVILQQTFFHTTRPVEIQN